MNSYEVEENGDLDGHMNSYVDINSYMSLEVDPVEKVVKVVCDLHYCVYDLT